MSLADILRNTILHLRSLDPKPLVVDNYLFVLEDIQKSLGDPNYQPHLHGKGLFSSDTRGEGCYTKLGYHAGWGGFNALPAETSSPLEAYCLFYAFIESFNEFHDRNDPRYKLYNTLLQGYKCQLDKPINDLSYEKWQRTGRPGLIAETRALLDRLKRYPSALSDTYQSILTQFANYLSDKRNPLEFDVIKALLQFDSWTNTFSLPTVSKDDLLTLLLIDDYVRHLKSDYPDTDDENAEHWGEMFSFINLLHDYRLTVLQDTPHDRNPITGLITQAKNQYFLIAPTTPLYAQIQEIVQTLNDTIGDAANKLVNELDSARRHEAEKSREQSLLFTLFLCLVDPILGCCFCCCNEVLTEADLVAKRHANEREVAGHLSFLSSLDKGLREQTLSYEDLPIINQQLDDFKDFALKLPEVKKIEGRFIVRLIDWLSNLLNEYFSAGIESRKVQTINTKLTMWQDLQPQLGQEKQVIEQQLQDDKRQILGR